MLLREKCLHILLEHFLGSDIFAKSAATAVDGGYDDEYKDDDDDVDDANDGY